MQSTFYHTVEPTGRTTKCSSRLASTLSLSFSSDAAIDFGNKRCPHSTIATFWELLFAFCCSLISSGYTLRYEDRNTILPESVPQIQLPDAGDGFSSLILDPPPTLMLGACLVLGCSVSSFTYRRQEHDRYQTLIFCVTLTAATLFGIALGLNTNLIMLGLLPWGLCLSMIFSIGAHWLVRRCSKRGVYTRIGCCETGDKEAASL